MITRLYAALLRLYPSQFRADFSIEMEEVFRQAIEDGDRAGEALRFFLRELRDLLPNLVREHWRSLTKKDLPMTTIKKPEWNFYPAWIILTTLCIPIAFFFDLIILKVTTMFVGDFIYVDGVRHITEDYLFTYTFVPVVGLLTGVLQFGLLRRYLPRMGWWVFATTGGWLNSWPPETFDIDLAFIVLGLSIGMGQWLLLRQRLPRASWWIGANIVGWVLLGLITTGNSFGQFGLFALGLLPACTTGVMLALLINQAQSIDPQGA